MTRALIDTELNVFQNNVKQIVDNRITAKKKKNNENLREIFFDENSQI